MRWNNFDRPPRSKDHGLNLHSTKWGLGLREDKSEDLNWLNNMPVVKKNDAFYVLNQERFLRRDSCPCTEEASTTSAPLDWKSSETPRWRTLRPGTWAEAPGG